MPTLTRRIFLATLPLLAAALGILAAFAAPPAPSATIPAAPLTPLAVEVIPATNTALAGGEFPATFRVTNISATTQSFKVMNCDWPGQWSSNNPNIGISAWVCDKNFTVTETLAPGQKYEQSAPLQISPTTPPGPQKFKFAFQPIDSKTQYWSAEQTLAIQPPKP